ncbi:MAG: M28 family peptidase [Candidatus Hodarchaeota archaeon]
MSVIGDNAYRITERLAFPRLIGSEGEKKAIDIVLDEFRKAGYDSIHRDKFNTSFYVWRAIRFLFLPIGFCLVLLAISFYINPWITLIMIGVNAFVASRALGMATTSEIKLMKNEEKNFETENIYVNLGNSDSKGKVVFIAHWDSKSQLFSSSMRITIILIAALGAIIILLLYLTLSIIQIFAPYRIPLLNHILLIISITISVIGLLNSLNKTGNNSPGAYDNAGGVGVVIELANYFKNNSVSNLEFTFLCTSSEELNLGGIKNYLQQHKDKLDKDSTYFINLDLIGGNEFIRIITSFGIPRKVSSKKLNKLFLKSASELNIKAKDIYLPTGAWSDYMPAVQEGFDACWIASQPGLKLVHTKKDDMSIVSKSSMKDTLNLCVEVVKKLNNEFS